MKIYSINQDGSFNTEFYRLLSAGKLNNVQQRFDFDINDIFLEGEYRECK